MKILVTGGCGFIMSNFIKLLLREHPDYRIVNIDKLTYAANPANLKDVEKNPNYQFVKGDICDRAIVEKVARDVDIIVNGAAETHVDRSIIEADAFVRTDVLGTHVLLEAARKFGVKRFEQISTDEVYGSILSGSFSEGDCINPSNPYSASKAGADMLARSYFSTYGLPVVITRSTNNYGPCQHPEKLIPKLIIKAIQGKELPIYGDGRNVRDWIFVEDNCRAIEAVMENGKGGEIYNVGGGNERSNIDVANLILHCLGKPESLIKFVKDRPGHDRRYSLDCGKLKASGWSPEVGFEEGIRKTVEWYRSNEWWWKPLVKENLDFW
jgi:dTDP-glucose 4,6-dehydratase